MSLCLMNMNLSLMNMNLMNLKIKMEEIKIEKSKMEKSKMEKSKIVKNKIVKNKMMKKLPILVIAVKQLKFGNILILELNIIQIIQFAKVVVRFFHKKQQILV